ncbi:MAG: histidinol-phosphate transaminase [Firmicutes bacterium]|nr:histidinol-phosphate transaminase [Bacillota bacterium]
MKKLPRRSCLQKITPYEPGKPVEELERELGLKNVIKMASNENPLGPSPMALEAVQRFLSGINFYPDGNAYLLKKDLAAYLGLQEENIIFGNGADELITLVGAAYLNPGDEIIMAHPSFSCYEFSALLMDAVPRHIPTKNFSFDLEAMAAAVTDRTKVIFICNPNNPTGTIVTHSQLESFLNSLPPEILVVIDEAYNEYVTDPDYPSSLALLDEGRNVLILRTFSKIYGLAGLRIGYGLAPREIIEDLNTVREPFNVNAVAQVAARAALKDKQHLLAGRELNRRAKEYFYREFERLDLNYVPTQSNFIFVDVKVNSRELYQSLLRKGIIVRPGDIFGYPQFLRISFGTEEQNRRFFQALEESLKELSSKKK